MYQFSFIILTFSKSILASMLDPERPHSIPSSPISIQSDGDSIFGESAPIFGHHSTICELPDTIPDPGPGFLTPICKLRGPATSSEDEDLSVQSLDRTGSLVDSDSLDHAAQCKFEQWVARSAKWIEACLAVIALDPMMAANLVQRDVIEYGDDCSGARAPYEALCQFVTKLRQTAFSSIRLHDNFASECPGSDGDGPRAFIAAQCPPRHYVFHCASW